LPLYHFFLSSQTCQVGPASFPQTVQIHKVVSFFTVQKSHFDPSKLAPRRWPEHAIPSGGGGYFTLPNRRGPGIAFAKGSVILSTMQPIPLFPTKSELPHGSVPPNPTSRPHRHHPPRLRSSVPPVPRPHGLGSMLGKFVSDFAHAAARLGPSPPCQILRRFR